VTVQNGAEHDHSGWAFVTNHTMVLLCIASDSEMRISDIAKRVRITERRVQAIVAELEDDGYLTRTRFGRRNHYEIDGAKPLRQGEADRRLGELLMLLSPAAEA
jgi:DNA-binding IclR family transcriptional regulator